MTPKTDSVAVLRNIRDRIEGCGDLSSAMKKSARLAALDAAIAALSAQGEAVAVVDEDHGLKGVTLLDRNLPVGTNLYTAPGGVGDAVTEEMRAPASEAFKRTMRALHRHDFDNGDFAIIWNAARAARTGKGE